MLKCLIIVLVHLYSDRDYNYKVYLLTIRGVSFKRKSSVDKKEEDKGAEDEETKVVTFETFHKNVLLKKCSR